MEVDEESKRLVDGVDGGSSFASSSISTNSVGVVAFPFFLVLVAENFLRETGENLMEVLLLTGGDSAIAKEI